MPLIFPNVGNLSSAVIRDAEAFVPPLISQPMSERRPSDDLAELQGMMRLTGRTVSGLGEVALPRINPSTLNKAWNRLVQGKGKRPITRTMESLRRGLRDKGYKDADWLTSGIDLQLLTIALSAVAKAEETIRPETAPAAAAMVKRIMDRLASQPELSHETAVAVGDAVAEELRISLPRK